MLNREALLFELDTLIGHLSQYQQAMANGDEEALRALLKEGRIGDDRARRRNRDGAGNQILLPRCGCLTVLGFAHNLDLDQIGALREALLGELSELRPQTADITFISTVTGAALDTSILDGEYWFANLRQPPLLEHAVRWAHEHGYRYFIETSPHPVLTRDIQSILDPRGRR